MESVKERRAVGELRQFISFFIAEEEYGLELQHVKEVIRVVEITRLPRAPSFVTGIINLRGDVIPIIDLRDRFGLDARETTAATRVIVAEAAGHSVGMVADSASQVVRIPPQQIEPPPALVGGFLSRAITGVAKLGDRLVILLDAEAVLNTAEKHALVALGGGAAGKRSAK